MQSSHVHRRVVRRGAPAGLISRALVYKSEGAFVQILGLACILGLFVHTFRLSCAFGDFFAYSPLFCVLTFRSWVIQEK